MLEDENGDLMCEECSQPKCGFCGEDVESLEIKLCSQHCVDGWKYDNRDKML